MRWFQGKIAAGIGEAKQRKTLFVVYIRNDSEESKKMDSTWESPEVSAVCEQFGLVTMRFQADSEECQMFSQYYPVLVVPSVSFISGESGVPLEGTAGSEDADQFVQRIKKVVQTSKATSSSEEPTGSPSPTQSSESNPPQTKAPPNQKENLEERAARIRKKMEEVHAKKDAQKKQAVHDTELERRKVGQAMQKARQTREGDEARKVAEELRKERMEDKVAKQKVKEQIARDRAEKEARFAATKAEKEMRIAADLVDKEESRRADESAKTAVKMETARIQFRLPDGSKILHQFSSSATLQEAHQFLVEEIGDTLKEFSMSTTFPRRRFGAGDMQTTMLDLQLVPSAAVIVLPGSPSSSDSSSGAVSASNRGSLIAMLFAPIIFLWNLFYTFIFGTAATQSEPPQSRAPADSASSSEEQAYQSMGARPKSSYARRRTAASSGDKSISRKDGNVHKFYQDDDDEDDENKTWNGNSTQQM